MTFYLEIITKLLGHAEMFYTNFHSSLFLSVWNGSRIPRQYGVNMEELCDLCGGEVLYR